MLTAGNDPLRLPAASVLRNPEHVIANPVAGIEAGEAEDAATGGAGRISAIRVAEMKSHLQAVLPVYPDQGCVQVAVRRHHRDGLAPRDVDSHHAAPYRERRE